jgi:predicted lipid-binding transport protein (Tim44 family)
VRVSAELDDYVIDGSGGRIEHTGNAGGETSLREYWTLGKRDGHWTLLSIEQDEEGEHQLAEPMEADPSEDARLTDEARVEQAVADRLPEGYTTAEVADEDAGDAEQRLRDMSLNDERFDPDIVEAAVRRGVAAWAQAVDGDDTEFAHVAQPELLRQLLYPSGDGSRSLRVVVRAPVVRKVTFTGLDTSSDPATVTVHMQLEGIRYVEDRNTLTLVGGSKDRPTRFDGTWTLALDGAPDVPWRIARVRDDMPPS